MSIFKKIVVLANAGFFIFLILLKNNWFKTRILILKLKKKLIK